jgi:DNA-directed RNA polymerase specialized sigma24 family protein
MSDWAATLGALVRERGAALFGYAYVLTGSTERSETLLHDAIARTFRTGRGSRGLDSAHAEVRRAIAAAVIRDARRSADASPTVADAALGHAMPLDLQTALLTLPTAERVCVVLNYLEELPVEAVAAQSRLAEATVERHIADGIASLRALGVDLDFTEHFTIAVADGRPR